MSMSTTFQTQLLRFSTRLFIAYLYGCIAIAASAQRNPVHSSIEAYVAQADCVYVGTVSQVEMRDRAKEGDYTATLTIDATKTLKGDPCNRFQVFVYSDETAAPFRVWSQKRTSLLWFLRRNKGDDGSASPIKYWSSITIDPAESLTPLPAVGYFSMEFRLIRSPRQVLEIARRYAKASSKTAELHSLRYMPDLVHRLFPYNAGGELLVPIGQQLERVARRMILSPGSLLPSERELKGIGHDTYLAIKATDEGSVRRMGVEALAHFKSDANIDLLKRQLGDLYFESSWDGDHNVYPVRKMAFNTLRKWGVQVTEPQLHLHP